MKRILLVRSSSLAHASLLAILVGVSGCTEPIDAPSAFSDEHYLCDAEHLADFDAQVATCRKAGSCLGYLSFRGLVDSQVVVVDAPVTLVKTIRKPELNASIANGMVIGAASPYFGVRMTFHDLVVPGVGAASNGVEGSGYDAITLEARGGNSSSNWNNSARTIQLFTTEEDRFSFSADLAKNGHLEGCLDIFFPQTK